MVSTEKATTSVIPWEKVRIGMFVKTPKGNVSKVIDIVGGNYIRLQPIDGYSQYHLKSAWDWCKFSSLSRKEIPIAQRAFVKRQIKFNNLHYDISCSIGSDPEIFITGKGGEIIPAWTFLKGKNDPARRADAAYWDGFQAEFNTKPDTCMGFHGDSLQGNLLNLVNILPAGAQLSHFSTLQVPGKELQTAAKEYVSLGCLPSLNAYGDKGRHVPDPRNLPFRFAGGHIHIGPGLDVDNTKYNLKRNAKAYVKAIDACLGMASVALFDGLDNPIRRQYYGLAGEYRLPKHGLEYRVLSNAWLTHPALAHWAFDMCRASFQFAKELKYWFSNYSEARVRDTINSGNADDARKWIKENQALYNSLAVSHHSVDADSVINYMYEHGAMSLMDLKDITGNWLIDTRWITHSEGVNCNFSHFAVNKYNKVMAA